MDISAGLLRPRDACHTIGAADGGFCIFAYLKGLFAPSGRAALLGLGFLQSWMYVVSQRLIFDSVDFQLAFHLGMAAALFVVAFIGHRSACVGLVFPDYRAGCVCDVMAAVGMALLPFVAIVSLIFAPMAPSLGALLEPVAFSILAGSSLGWCFARWFALYCLLPARDGMCYLLAAFALGALGCLTFCLMGVLFPVAPLVCALLLPAGSAVALHRAHAVIEGDSDSDLADDEIDGGSVTTGQRRLSRLSTEILPAADGARQLRHARRKTAPPIVQVVIYALVFGNGIVFGVLQGDGLPSTGLFAANILNYALRAILPALLMLWLAAQSADGTTSLRAALNAVLLALAFALLSLWFIGGFEGIVAYAAVAAARNLVLCSMPLSSNWHM